MPLIRYAVRRARTRTDKQKGVRWIAQAEFPGGRTIKLAGTRTRPPAVVKIRREARNAYQQAANSGAVASGGGGDGGNAGRGFQQNVVLE